MFIYLLNMSFHNILYMIFNFIEKKNLKITISYIVELRKCMPNYKTIIWHTF